MRISVAASAFITILISFALAGCLSEQVKRTSPVDSREISGIRAGGCPGGFEACDVVKIARVIDGDTFATDARETVRLIGVDTPETVRSGSPIQCFGKEASDFSKKILTDRDVVLSYEADERTDKYGRTLAYAWLDMDENGRLDLFNLALVEDGYAYAYTDFPFDFETEFLSAESKAKDAKRGLWAACEG